MGSAESSTLQSVESLSATLDEINQKLIAIEDIHLHHERIVCTDEIIIVHGRRIKCLSSVEIIVGPVVGLVGENFIRFLLEINRDTELTINVFLSPNNLNTDIKHQFTTVSIRDTLIVLFLITFLLILIYFHFSIRRCLLLLISPMYGIFQVYYQERIILFILGGLTSQLS